MEMVDNGGELVSAMALTMQDQNGTDMAILSGALQAGGREIATVDGSMDRGTDAMSIRLQSGQEMDGVEFHVELTLDGDLGISVHGGLTLRDEWETELFHVAFSGEQKSTTDMVDVVVGPTSHVMVSGEADVAIESRRVAEIRGTWRRGWHKLSSGEDGTGFQIDASVRLCTSRGSTMERSGMGCSS